MNKVLNNDLTGDIDKFYKVICYSVLQCRPIETKLDNWNSIISEIQPFWSLICFLGTKETQKQKEDVTVSSTAPTFTSFNPAPTTNGCTMSLKHIDLDQIAKCQRGWTTVKNTFI